MSCMNRFNFPKKIYISNACDESKDKRQKNVQIT